MSDPYYLDLSQISIEALSYLPKPISIFRFEGVSESTVAALKGVGIGQGKQLLERCASESERSELSKQTGVTDAELIELSRMANFTRITGVGPMFARILVSVGIEGLESLSRTEPKKHAEELREKLDDIGYAGAPVTEWDVKHYIETAGALPKMLDIDRCAPR